MDITYKGRHNYELKCEGRYVCIGCFSPQRITWWRPFRLAIHMREHVGTDWAGTVVEEGFDVTAGAGHKIAFLCFSHGMGMNGRVTPRLEELVDDEVESFRLPGWAVWRRGDRVARPDRDKAGVPAH